MYMCVLQRADLIIIIEKEFVPDFSMVCAYIKKNPFSTLLLLLNKNDCILRKAHKVLYQNCKFHVQNSHICSENLYYVSNSSSHSH